jgi:RNA-directed DNA polymerase
VKNPVTLDEILSPVRIAAAWEKLRANDGAAGEDSITIRDLEESLPHLWPTIVESIRSSTYEPIPLRPVHIPKPSGGTRKLAIPSVIDRLIQHSMASALGERWESRFPTASYAYRPGTGAQPALDAILKAAKEVKNPVALRMDIRDFFDRITRDSLSTVLHETPCDVDSVHLIRRCLSAPIAGPLGPVPSQCGIPQGSPLSPLLSNAVLLPFDHAFTSTPGRLFRYADDMLVLCPDVACAQAMLAHASEALGTLQLELNPSKTRILPLAAATFLGFGFQQTGDDWHRALCPETQANCLQYLRRMEDSGKSPTQMLAFLRQWTAYFLPGNEDRVRHSRFLRETLSSFRLPMDEPFPSPRHSPPPGFNYDGSKPGQSSRLKWAARFLLRRVHFGLHFKRKGFLPIPSGLHLTIAGHRIHFKF